MAEEEVEELLEQELWIKDKFKVRVRFTVASYRIYLFYCLLFPRSGRGPRTMKCVLKWPNLVVISNIEDI